ncbi:hypothetical protein BDP27DRAFT_1368446 [Rhodocollybia butyracea]|uniref:Uncharacterized protein n=1 Tax=Rhodocollybia butyracea TaxID=206335 RepID=A0A9P5U1Y3_9AGAR|nr:hypothetical protein BDP27DRAFT_1368446 [Rhodocollybia butyracea]
MERKTMAREILRGDNIEAMALVFTNNDTVTTVRTPSQVTSSVALSFKPSENPGIQGQAKSSEIEPKQLFSSQTLLAVDVSILKFSNKKVVRKKRELKRNWQTMLQAGPSANAHPTINELIWTREWIDWERPERDYKLPLRRTSRCCQPQYRFQVAQSYSIRGDFVRSLSQSVGDFLARLGPISAKISPEYRARLSKTEQYRGNWRSSFRSIWLGLGRPDFHWASSVIDVDEVLMRLSDIFVGDDPRYQHSTAKSFASDLAMAGRSINAKRGQWATQLTRRLYPFCATFFSTLFVCDSAD